MLKSYDITSRAAFYKYDGLRIYHDEKALAVVELEDTADFQKFEMPDEIYYNNEGGTMKIEILETL